MRTQVVVVAGGAIALAACQAKSSPTPAIDEVTVAPADPRRMSSPLPEVGPHPDYPTPVGAGTDKIFFLEEPDRGPQAPASFARPPDAALTWTSHGHCLASEWSVTCSGTPGAASWRVAKQGAELTIAEERIGDRVVSTYVYTAKPDGTRLQMIELDGYGQVRSARMFTPDARYTHRYRNGGNALAGCGFMAYKLDAQQRPFELACLQWLGEPMLDTSGVAVEKLVRDAHGLVIERASFGLDGAPAVATTGVHRTVYSHDANGRVLTEQYFDLATAVRDTTGCAGRAYVRDARGLVTEERCLDAAQKPMRDGTGIAIVAMSYDARGCLIGQRAFDHERRPAADPDGVHGADLGVDAQCGIYRWSCRGLTNKPQACGPDGPATYLHTLDARGQQIASTFQSADGAAAHDPSYGVAELRRRFDERGNAISMSCHGVTGPVECRSTGFHENRSEYDDAGRRMKETFFGVDGAPTLNLGTAMRRSRYDNYDHLYEAQNLDAAGKLVQAAGVATRRELYDQTHRMFGIVLLDAKGRPAHYTACFTNMTCPEQPWHAMRLVRAGTGLVTTAKFFDAAGQLLATIDCRKAKCWS